MVEIVSFGGSVGEFYWWFDGSVFDVCIVCYGFGVSCFCDWFLTIVIHGD